MTDGEREKTRAGSREEDILEFWNERSIFEKTLAKDAPNGEFVFYDGPPFATGLPHYGHILAGTIKDAIPRYKTMRGYRVRRHWGWDCHGLPLENEIEKELGLETKRDIEEHGIEQFNEAARAAVLRYADEWRRIVPRMGRWVDMERDYRTMDARYIESVWWVFKRLSDKKLVYEGYKSMHLCPRCGTTLSNFEVAQGYKDITDISVMVKMELVREPGTFLLAWTTTPWTLPGNMAAAVHKDAEYVKFTLDDSDEQYIAAKELLEDIVGDKKYTVVDTFTGEKLVGERYTPPFSYYQETDLSNKEKAWKVYHAPYVSMDEGTGIVHLAPAFGEEDLQLAQEHGIPIVHHVTLEGVFAEDVTDFAGMAVKQKDAHQEADIAIIKHLAGKGTLFTKEKVEHSYPHCWRCDTPLLNYAATSWFVEVTKLRDKLITENKKIRWVPPEVGTGRFGTWLEGVRDWAVSRSRYWGAPLPVWKHPDTGARYVFGSVDELAELAPKSGNTYYCARHGEAESNKEDRIDSYGRNGKTPLTEKGKEEAKESARKFADKNITKIIASPLTRTWETAEIIAEECGLSKDDVICDERIREIELGELDGKPISAYKELAETYEERFKKAPEGGETLSDVRKRMGDFLYELEDTYSNENICIITHEYPLWMVKAVGQGLSREDTLMLNSYGRDFIETGGSWELTFKRLPHNREYEIDLHRPYIDELKVCADDGTRLERVEEVFDCWFESGSMPYAQHHYPFENTDVFEPNPGFFRSSRGFPADFIAEGLDQTRGWFYSLLVLGTGLFGKRPYKNVIVNGTVLAADEQKMSKRLKNYPDPMDIVNTYGADAMRYYLLSSPVVRAEDFSFSEDGVAEVERKNIGRLENVTSFFETYRTEHTKPCAHTEHVLDRWIVARLKDLSREVTEAMDAYELDRASRPIAGFIDDLSTWYLRRSRERFKNGGDDGEAAAQTTCYVLQELTKILAPFMPFFAEHLWQRIGDTETNESVHLAEWPHAFDADARLIERMKATRDIVSEALEARASAGYKVRQPLAELSVASDVLGDEDTELVELIKDEVNVKTVTFTPDIEGTVELDTELTDELKREGAAREFIRAVQDARKAEKCDPLEHITLVVKTDEADNVLEEWKELITEKTLSKITFGEVGDDAHSADLGECGTVRFTLNK